MTSPFKTTLNFLFSLTYSFPSPLQPLHSAFRIGTEIATFSFVAFSHCLSSRPFRRLRHYPHCFVERVPTTLPKSPLLLTDFWDWGNSERVSPILHPTSPFSFQKKSGGSKLKPKSFFDIFQYTIIMDCVWNQCHKKL